MISKNNAVRCHFFLIFNVGYNSNQHFGNVLNPLNHPSPDLSRHDVWPVTLLSPLKHNQINTNLTQAVDLDFLEMRTFSNFHF